ncbi:MAG TPA: hypothetical protein PLR69_12330, partial [Candidatus Limiplasma sp.]|nr:hypothetical protein [Candidatus Limiplasma sp.]
PSEPRRQGAPAHTRPSSMESGPRSMRQPTPARSSRFGPTRTAERPQPRMTDTQIAPQHEESPERENTAQPGRKRKFESR